MPDVMLRPNWPSAKFFRTVTVVSKKGDAVTRRIEFAKFSPTTLTDKEFEQVKPDIGKALFEVEYDEKLRPRLLAPEAEEANPTPAKAEA
jgi:hypothetical protein